MKPRESLELAEKRWALLTTLQEHYSNFIPFLRDVMEELGFGTTEIQEDIGNFMEFGPQYLMVQAQRSQAKTTIAAAFAVWTLIHSPAHRVLIVSCAGKQAGDISTLIVRIIMNMDVLSCMRPDKMAGDRTSVEDFDIHHSLKGMDKSSSVGCFGIDSNIQGLRADLLIPDDVESGKNSATSVQRAKLLHITKDFTSINQSGRILWLGTPQTMESIYNSLPMRGVTIRIWPGRYPTPKQALVYGDRLAPLLRRRLMVNPGLATGGGFLGDQGSPIDVEMPGLDEAGLQKKELDQGTPYFQLQHMLNTAMMDALRFPLKPELLVTLRPAGDLFPMSVVRGMESQHLEDHVICDHQFRLTRPHELSRETAKLQSTWAYVDPAAGGANGDETAYAIGGFLNGNIYLLSAGGIPGGYRLDLLEELARRLARYKLDGVTIEKNMGFGAFKEVFAPVLRKVITCQIDDDLVSGQKEMRIINTLAPVMGRGSLIVHPDVLLEDADCCAGYTAALRQSYSLFFQLAKMSSTRGALIHDDRCDALEGLVRHYQQALAQDQEKAVAAVKEAEMRKLRENPLGYRNHTYTNTVPNMRRRNR